MNQAELFRLHPEYRHPKPPPARLKLTRPDPAEAKILASVLQALNFYASVAWFTRANCAAGKLIYPDGSTSQYMRFGFPGCADIIGQLKPRRPGEPGAWLAIECKRAGGRLSEAQEAFLAKVNANGGCGFVCRSVSDLQQHLGES